MSRSARMSRSGALRRGETTEVLGPLRRDRRGAARAAVRPAGGGAGRVLPELGPRGVGALLDMATDALRARFWTCLSLTAPLWLAVWGVHRLLITTETIERMGWDDVTVVLFQGGLQSAVRAVAMALVTLVVHGYVQGRALGAFGALRACLRRAPALLALSVVTGFGMAVATGCGFVCFFVPPIALGWLWAVAPAVLVLEGAGPLEALSRSMRLARKGFHRWAGVMAVQYALTAPVLAGMAGLNDPTLRDGVRGMVGLGEPWFTLFDLSLASLLSGFSTALAAVVLTIYYLDQRVRVEGFDLELGLARLAAARAPAEGARA